MYGDCLEQLSIREEIVYFPRRSTKFTDDLRHFTPWLSIVSRGCLGKYWFSLVRLLLLEQSALYRLVDDVFQYNKSIENAVGITYIFFLDGKTT